MWDSEKILNLIETLIKNKADPTLKGNLFIYENCTPLDLLSREKEIAVKKIIAFYSPTPRYPFFLQNMNVKPKQLTSQKVANALWLSDKDVNITNVSKEEFRLWAEHQNLAFTQNDVDDCLLQYTMKQ